MALETFSFDPAEFLTDVDSQVELVQDALESGDVGYIAHALGVVARARGMTQVAKDAGVTREALYRTLSQEGDPKLSTLLGVLKALDITLHVEKLQDTKAA